MKRFVRFLTVAVWGMAVFMICAFSAGCAPLDIARAKSSPPSLNALESLRGLKKYFNQDNGFTRLVLLLSPGCPVCVSGANFIRHEILEAFPDAELRVYAVWFAMYPGDNASKWDPDILTDPRVMHFWDEDKNLGRWYSKNHKPSSVRNIEWDAYFLYDANSTWGQKPTRMISWGRTIMRMRQKLLETFRQVFPDPATSPKK